MRKMLPLALAVLAYTNGALANDPAPRSAQGPLQVAGCGAPCATEEAAPARAALDPSACSGADCVQDDAGVAKSSCDDDHPCFDP